MSDAANFHNGLIKGLGGKAKLARSLGLDRDTVTKWHRRGIPSKYWDEVVGIAINANPPVAVTHADLKRTKPASITP